MDENDQLTLNAWPGGESSPLCVDWVIRHQAVEDIRRAVAWQAAGQHLGILDEVMPTVTDGVLIIKGEWDRIYKEERENT